MSSPDDRGFIEFMNAADRLTKDRTQELADARHLVGMIIHALGGRITLPMQGNPRFTFEAEFQHDKGQVIYRSVKL